MERVYNEDEIRYENARRRVREIKGFYGNLSSYIVVNLFLMILNLLTSPEYLWFFWLMLGWGIGIAFHAVKVFFPFMGKEWEARKIQEFMEKEAASNKNMDHGKV